MKKNKSKSTSSRDRSSEPSPIAPQKSLVKGSVFCALQLMFLAIALVGASVWASSSNFRPRSPALASVPRTVLPLYDYPMVCSDEQLETVLKKIKPRFATKPPKTNFVDHALRLWGVDVEFQDNSIDGADLRTLLINHEVFGEVWGEKELPLLMNRDSGIAVRTQEGRSTVSHVDHLLGSLAEVGTTLDHPVVFPQNELATNGDQRQIRNEGTMRDLLRYATNSFRLNQKEYEWTTLALAFYATDSKSWVTKEGQEIDFDRLTRRIMRQVQPQGVCYGQHRLYTLTVLLRIDDQMQQESQTTLLSEAARAEVVEYLGEMTKVLFKNQSVEGFWDGNWADTSIPVRDPGTNELSRRVLATGHTLEWWAMAPKEVHPPRETIIRAGQWLAREVGAMDEKQIEKNYTFLTHAARALALWRGKFPAEHFANYQPEPFNPESNDESSVESSVSTKELELLGPAE